MFFVSWKKYDDMKARCLAAETMCGALKKEIEELNSKIEVFEEKEKKRSENARRAANIRHHKVTE